MQNKQLKKWAGIFLTVIIALTALPGCTIAPNSGMMPLEVNLLKVGKADAIILRCGEEVMVIDTGEEDDGNEVVEFLKNQGIAKVDALIITHFDQDHVGGADTLIEEMDVEEIYVPAYPGSHTEYLDFMQAVESKNLSPTKLTEAVRFNLGDAQVLVEPSLSYEADPEILDNDNNFSLITTVLHGENRLLFMGDAEKQRIRQWLDSSLPAHCDFLKVPHHGVYDTALQELFATLSPEYSVICSSKKNPADQKTVELLKTYGSQVFETKDGNITLISDGHSLELRQKR